MKKMDYMPIETVPVSRMSAKQIREFLRECSFVLDVEQVRGFAKGLGRDPNLYELKLLDGLGNEHCGYVSTRALLDNLYFERKLNVAPNVVAGGDAGVVWFAKKDGQDWCVAFKIESHNHPSAVEPYQGAATGIGGIVRDISVMNARVVGVLDHFRWGNPFGKNAPYVRYIANGTVAGVAGYANPYGAPNLGGDVVFSRDYDSNPLVNVCALGIVRMDQVMSNKIPRVRKEKYVLVLKGKDTDSTGYRGSSFASVKLDMMQEKTNKAAVQVAQPMLENVLHNAREDEDRVLAESGYTPAQIGRKDCGGSGIASMSSEAVAGRGGLIIYKDKIPVSEPDAREGVVPILSETQEREGTFCPAPVADKIRAVYNEQWDLPGISGNRARATVIGEVIDEDRYVIMEGAEVLCDAPATLLTEGYRAKRIAKPSTRKFREPEFREPQSFNRIMLRMLADPNIASKYPIFRRYDTSVQSSTVIYPGEADAGVISPQEIYPVGIAVKGDGNPFYGKINPRLGGAHAVAESARNVAAVGAAPWALTNNLNYGNPKKPVAYWQLREGMTGIAEASAGIGLKGHPGQPLPIVSGNISLYNESGNIAIPPSPIVVCLGRMEDVSKATTFRLKNPGDAIYLVDYFSDDMGGRRDELGGGDFYRVILNRLGANVPILIWDKEQAIIYGTVDAISAGLINASHDINSRGLLVAVAEQAIGGRGDGRYGAEVDLSVLKEDMPTYKKAFTGSTGFVQTVDSENQQAYERFWKSLGVAPRQIGLVRNDNVFAVYDGRDVVNLSLDDMKSQWSTGLAYAMR